MTATAHDGSPGRPVPDAWAPHSEWMSYAVDQGMPKEVARGLTRDQIRTRLGGASVPLGGEPSLDRFERDPETRDARRRANWPAWRQQ